MNIAIQLAPSGQRKQILQLSPVHPQPDEHSPEFLLLLDLVAKNKFFSSKYWASQKRSVLEDVRKLYAQNPSLSVKQVVLTILTDLPDFLPTWNVRNVVGFITEEWKTLSQADEAEEVPAP